MGAPVIVFFTVDEPDDALWRTGVVLFCVTAAGCVADADWDADAGCLAVSGWDAGADCLVVSGWDAGAGCASAAGCTTGADGETTTGCVPAEGCCTPVVAAVLVPPAPSVIVPFDVVSGLAAAPVCFAVPALPALPDMAAPSLMLPVSAVVTTELSESLDVPLSDRKSVV